MPGPTTCPIPAAPPHGSRLDDCPHCDRRGLTSFYQVPRVPAHSVLLMDSPEEARTYPTGAIDLAYCPACGGITNRRFDPELNQYSPRYEETQGYSPTFQTFHRRLAVKLMERHQLQDADILEIGCGKGEFLTLLCELGENRGLGFDPAFVPGRAPEAARHRVQFIPDVFSPAYKGTAADFVCCKMTLEHIHQTGEFLRMIRRTLALRERTIVFFQVPNAATLLQDRAFWDIYYEHCSYFTPSALEALFTHTGYEVLTTWTDYYDQYLMIEARPRPEHDNEIPFPAPPPGEPLHIGQAIADFARAIDDVLAHWRRRVATATQRGRPAVLWGAGSKAVAFLTTLGLTDEIAACVDINPHKQGTYLPGTGHPIIHPEALRELRPGTVFLMNPVYRAEVAARLHDLHLRADLIPLEGSHPHA